MLVLHIIYNIVPFYKSPVGSWIKINKRVLDDVCFNKRREFVRFILVGVLATATHYGIYFFLCVLMLPAIAYTIGYAISFILNFYLSNVFTFNTKPTVRKGIGFGISHFVNYLLHIGLLSLFIWIGVPERWAPLPVFALVVPVNFLLVRFVLKSKKYE